MLLEVYPSATPVLLVNAFVTVPPYATDLLELAKANSIHCAVRVIELEPFDAGSATRLLNVPALERIVDEVPTFHPLNAYPDFVILDT